MIAYELDHRLMSLAQKYGYDYTRYADDITLSSNTPFPESIIRFDNEGLENKWVLGEKLTNIIEDCGFRVNSDKTRLQSHLERQTVTGLTVNKKVNVARQYIREVRGMIHAYKKYGNDAIDVFLEKYQKSSYRQNKYKRHEYKEKDFFNVLAGKLVFIKMVRGAHDPVYLKLLSSAQGELIAHGLIPCDTKLTGIINFELV